jgi:hypothetical protein
MNSCAYFDEIMRRRLIVSEYINGHLVCSAGQKLRVLRSLVTLSFLGFVNPGNGLGGAMGGRSDVPQAERRAKYIVRRLAMLHHVKDDDEMRWLDYWAGYVNVRTRKQVDIIDALDGGKLEYKQVKSLLNSALGDIAKAQEERKKNDARQ